MHLQKDWLLSQAVHPGYRLVLVRCRFQALPVVTALCELCSCCALLQFVSDVMKPMLIEPLMDLEVQNLSGGELQRVALALCLGQPADIYLIDEPSAYLDSEQRIMASKVRIGCARMVLLSTS